MSQKNFKEFYLNELLTFLWKQWSVLGIAGGTNNEKIEWIIDIESLLVFSLEISRYEPRLFDEILNWLIINGKWIDIQRLRGIIKNKKKSTQRLISTTAGFLSTKGKPNWRKWITLATEYLPQKNDKKQVLFKTKNGNSYPIPNKKSGIFQSYGFIREEVNISNKSLPVQIAPFSNMRIPLRAFFGIGSRSECILYLLTHEAGHPSEIAEEIGISVRGTQDTLIELSESGLILTRSKGKRKIEYWLSQKRWWEFLFNMNEDDIEKPTWLNWISFYNALMGVWNILNEIEKIKSNYIKSSKLREAMESISIEFQKSRINLPDIPGRNIKPDTYRTEFENFIKKVLGADNETDR